MTLERPYEPIPLRDVNPDEHLPQRGVVSLTQEEHAAWARGERTTVTVVRREGPFMVTYWNAPIAEVGQPFAGAVDLFTCVATWERV